MTTPLDALLSLPDDHDRGRQVGLTSICSAHPLVIEAALIEAREAGAVPLIEATCNQVNHEGGYTGMTPAGFRAMVRRIAREVGVEEADILFGGDHLGPNPWKHLPAEAAMGQAVEMTRAYAEAGFGKIHLDASMACAGDPVPLPPETIAARAARLAAAAEAGARAGGHPPPAYIVGTEVPIPGGATGAGEAVTVSSPEDTARTMELHQTAFREEGLDAAFGRIAAVVVQPGVEFGQTDIHRYAPDAARELVYWRDKGSGLVFEAHSTDYQTPAALHRLVRDGFAILKVGPGLTFALREAFYGLDFIAGEMDPDYRAGALREAMEAAMQADPGHWRPYVQGGGTGAGIQRHFGLSDRIRYYWPAEGPRAAVERMSAALEGRDIPWPLISQCLGRLADPVAEGRVAPRARDLVIASIRAALAPYTAACAARR
ncbi:class II D-tagatose-bisphosphate aldolase, non-catalytic subunit [Wenxinia saemankumensis]|uniref:Tagatose-bisphosphate aldolase noncatalytic subunit n=1 Tax=Wenxinia saemankumensis TaxID=1447782 RepID=A0A1M6HPP9_9RHOB|nr:class II D-tagatose-bisphosphate aldolase, non-catalytic subunit [Wenxinia saemankumensis]SHJ24185.1 tagatose-bisphosphate aldolase noncatalytic subunit [Wenxinia saemankumensis]